MSREYSLLNSNIKTFEMTTYNDGSSFESISKILNEPTSFIRIICKTTSFTVYGLHYTGARDYADFYLDGNLVKSTDQLTSGARRVVDYQVTGLDNVYHILEIRCSGKRNSQICMDSVIVDNNLMNANEINNYYFIKDDNKYYSLLDSNYSSGKYNEITMENSLGWVLNNGVFDVNKLFTDTTINGETFKPITKFKNPKLIAYYNDNKINILGRKSNKQLVIASASFVTKIANNIDYFKVISNIENNSYIKMAVSIDAGVTWKTTNDNGTTWNDLTNKMPLKDYEIMTSEEKIQWNNLLTEIDTDGFDISNIENINFNTLNSEIIMFAYVLYQDNYNDACNNISLEWQFDSKGKMLKMNDTEYEVVLTEDRIVYTPKIDNDLIKVNIINGVLSGTGTSSDINAATSDDIQDILNKRWN